MSTQAEPRVQHHMPAFEVATVADAMHNGVVSCLPETPLRIVAQIMATHRIHGLVVLGDPRDYTDGRPWRFLSDVDVVRASAADFASLTAGDAAANPIVAVSPGDPLHETAALMTRHIITHLVVVDPGSDQPMGIISTLDVMAALGWGRGDGSSV